MRQRLLLLILAILIPGGIYGYNYIHLEIPLTKIIESKPSYQGIQIHSYYYNFITPSKVIFDVMSVENASASDIFSILAAFAKENKNNNYQEIILAYKGNAKFIVSGDLFKKLATETTLNVPVNTIRYFIENVKNLDGSNAFSPLPADDTSLLQVQFEDFSNRWYASEVNR